MKDYAEEIIEQADVTLMTNQRDQVNTPAKTTSSKSTLRRQS